MKKRECLKIAILNIWCKKRKSLSLCANLTVVLALISLWMVTTYSFLQANNDIIYGMASMCYFSVEASDEQENKNENKDDLHIEGVVSKTSYSGVDIVDYVGMEEKWTFANIKHVKINVDGKEYVGENDYSYDFENEKLSDPKKSVRFKMGICLSEEFFSQNQIIEYEYENDNTYKNAIISGSSSIKEGELLITNYYLDKFGIDEEDYDELIGKKISIYCAQKQLLDEFTVAGIVDSRLYYTDALFAMPQLIIKGNESTLEKFGCEDVVDIYYLKDYDSLVKVYEEMEDEDDIIMLEGYENAVKCCVIEDSSLLVEKIISVFGLLLITAFIMNIAQIIWNDLRNKESYIGISMVNGMRTRHILLIEYIQLLILTIIANIVAQVITIILYKVLGNVMFNYLGIELGMDVKIFAGILLITSVVVSLVVFVMELPVLLNMVRKEPSMLLRSASK